MRPDEIVLLAQSARIGILVGSMRPKEDAQRLYQAIRRLGADGLQVRMSYWPEGQLAIVNRQIGQITESLDAKAPAIPADEEKGPDL